MKETLIGTSGWNYRHWKGVFYPKNLPQRRWFIYYTEHFNTVEINATFYRRPKPATLTKWYKETPDNFIFSIKANRYITHIKKLRDVGEALHSMYRDTELLKEKLGALLFQLPPSLGFSPQYINEFFKQLDTNTKTVMEVRHSSFLCNEFYELLRKYNIASCVSDTAGKYPMIIEDTADFFYIRLHGSRVLYKSLYSKDELSEWKKIIKSFQKGGFVFFDNDFCGNAVINAKQLKEMLSET